MAPKNILLLGYGGAGHDGGLLTDTIIVAHIIPKERKVVLISIPRDLWVPVETKAGIFSEVKINAVYAIGIDDRKYPDKPEKYRGKKGALLLTNVVVGSVTGLSIDWTIAVDFSGFTKFITVLGGIFVDVPQTFEDTQYPIEGKEKETCGKSEEDMKALTATLSGSLLEKEFPCRWETLKFEKGKQFMDGVTALKFVRSRHSDVNGGDFGRSIRQQAFLMGVKNRLLSFSSPAKIISLLDTAYQMIHTDLTLDDLTLLLQRYGNPSSYEIHSIAVTDQNALEFSNSSDGQSILIPKSGNKEWSGIIQFLTVELERIQTASGSAVVQ